MREILFRGKRFENGKWVFGNHLYDDISGKHYIIPFGNINESDKVGQEGCCYCVGFEVIPETVGQYTGLTDKNGKKIFEGDILRRAYYPEEDMAVLWHDGRFNFKRAKTSKDYPYESICCVQNAVNILKVIGNIHDNPCPYISCRKTKLPPVRWKNLNRK